MPPRVRLSLINIGYSTCTNTGVCRSYVYNRKSMNHSGGYDCVEILRTKAMRIDASKLVFRRDRLDLSHPWRRRIFMR
jgi:hypothetical protein